MNIIVLEATIIVMIIAISASYWFTLDRYELNLFILMRTEILSWVKGVKNLLLFLEDMIEIAKDAASEPLQAVRGTIERKELKIPEIPSLAGKGAFKPWKWAIAYRVTPPKGNWEIPVEETREDEDEDKREDGVIDLIPEPPLLPPAKEE